MKPVRVRFAPSPTGGLHLGGVRTALFNYLFAKKNNGTFVLRIEDTDQTRFVKGAEEYIIESLEWCGILPDEGPMRPGNFGPYRQSERKEMYRQYAEKLVADGHAYYAFDTPEEIEAMRDKLKSEGKELLQYGRETRAFMKNSLSMNEQEVQQLIKDGVPHVIRLKVEEETISFTDMIRGKIEMNTASVDDKVLLKADGMPTYHLAVVVDDYSMEITHAFRGEEWLPSAPVHVLLYKYLGWIDEMPQWAHLPLILKPDGNGKLSKRDGERLGFPVFPLEWNDPVKGHSQGFREMGFLPEAFINMLVMLGWNDGTAQEIYSLEELSETFSVQRIHAHGAKFDFEKAKWFNHEWIKKLSIDELTQRVYPFLQQHGFDIEDGEKLEKIISLVRDRCTLLYDFVEQSSFFFKAPETIDIKSIEAKWSASKYSFFEELISTFESLQDWNHEQTEKVFKELATRMEIKPGELMLPLRIMLVGGKFGPGVFEIASLIGKNETCSRIKKVLDLLSEKKD